jgi:beta-lactamase regulating signal transducer with metallopeptidase domain
MQWILIADAFRAALAGTGSRLAATFVAFAHAAAPMAVSALWQGAAVAVALVLCLRLAPHISAAHRFAVWAAGFAVVVGLPFLPLPVHSDAASVSMASPLQGPAARPWLQLDSRWGFLIAALWITASALRAAQLGFHSLRLRKLWKSAAPVDPGGSLRSLLAAASPARRSIQLCTTLELDRPSIVGFFSPRILIPEWLFDRLSPEELEQVVLHEVEHLRRRDDWTNLLQKLALVLFPLNPALAWMERHLCREREMACDEGVVRRTQAPGAYAACLTSLVERGLEQRDLLRRAHALSLGAFERRSELVRRVHSILWRKQALHPLAARAFVALVGCALLFGSLQLARRPPIVAFVAAQKPDLHAAAFAPEQSRSVAAERALFVSSAGVGPTRATAGFRAIDKKAVLPSRRNAPAPLALPSPRRAAAQSAGTIDPEIAETNADAPQEEFVKAVALNSASGLDQSQTYVVFTAWEVTRISTRQAREVTDYDAGAAAQPQNSAPNGRLASEPATQITVTRLILGVYPASSVPGQKTSHATCSSSGRPAALPADSGWLVFQL